MTVFWKAWANLLSFLLLCSTGAVLGQFQLEPVNVTKLYGSDVQFTATVLVSWKFITWNVGGYLVLTMPVGGGPTSSSPRFSARFCSSSSSTCVEFTIHNVTRRDTGPVLCSVQGDVPVLPKMAQLYVQEKGSVSISGGNRTVKQEEQVEFQCETKAWFPAATISWTLNGQTVNSSLINTTSVTNGDTYNSSSVLKFQAIRNTTVTCLATIPTLPTPLSYLVQLAVVPKPTDWTVLIAIVVSFSSFALLVLLIIGVIFCYKRRKEKKLTYQAEMMRQRTHSQLSNRPTVTREGQDNPVFVINDHTSLPPSEHSDSGFFQINGAPFYEQPTVDNSSQQGNGYNGAHTNLELSFPKHRHVTIV